MKNNFSKVNKINNLTIGFLENDIKINLQII